MKKHKQIYMEHFGLCCQDVVLCEVCNKVAVDIHHIQFKSQGGTNHIGNLIALCRHDHDRSHGKVKGKTLSREVLQDIVDNR